MSRIDYGQVTLDLDGETIVLTPTVDAIQRINRHFGSIRQAIVHCRELDFDGLLVVIAAGAGYSPGDAKTLAEPVFRSGLVSLSEPVGEYLFHLLDPLGTAGSQDDGANEGKG